MEDQKFLEGILKGIVEYPNDVIVERKVDEIGVLLTIKANPLDIGKIIGREGNTAKALRTLVRIVGMKSQLKVNVSIDDPKRKANSNFIDKSYQQATEY